jgi:para-nitrobenzyl esterase
MVVGLIAIGALASPAVAANVYTTTDTTIITLLNDPAARAIIDKDLPGLSNNPKIDMIHDWTLRQVQQYAPDKFTDERLAVVDADLATIAAGK